MKKGPKNFSEKEVEHIAWLARIELSDEEKKLFTHQLNTIIDFFHIIDDIDTRNVNPTFHVLTSTNVVREDRSKDSMPTEMIFTNTMNKEKGYFKAPKMV